MERRPLFLYKKLSQDWSEIAHLIRLFKTRQRHRFNQVLRQPFPAQQVLRTQVNIMVAPVKDKILYAFHTKNNALIQMRFLSNQHLMHRWARSIDGD